MLRSKAQGAPDAAGQNRGLAGLRVVPEATVDADLPAEYRVPLLLLEAAGAPE